MSRSVAVIGSGMAGLTAARRCRQAGFEVTLFERSPGLGMDAHSLAVHGGRVDVPLRVMSPGGWRRVLALAQEMGVGTYGVDTFVSCSDSDGQTWFRSTRLPLTGWPFAGSWRYLNLQSLRLGRDLLKLSRAVRALGPEQGQRSLAEFLELQRFDPLFWRGLMLPLLTTICTCEERHLLAWPAGQLLAVLDEVMHGAGLVRLRGGTSALVAALAKDIDCISGSPVTRVADRGERMAVVNARGEVGLFDRVIIATQANQLEFLEGNAYAAERALLSQVPYDSGVLWVHSDERFMPRHGRDWVALNFQADAQLSQPMFTVWVNAIEPTLRDAPPVLQTWNPLFPPAPEQVFDQVPLQRALVDAGSAERLRQLDGWHRQPGRRLFYCGSWAYPGIPLLESAVASAEAVVGLISEQLKHA